MVGGLGAADGGLDTTAADTAALCGDRGWTTPPTLPGGCLSFEVTRCREWAQSVAPSGTANAWCLYARRDCVMVSTCTPEPNHVCRCGAEPECAYGSVCVTPEGGGQPHCVLACGR